MAAAVRELYPGGVDAVIDAALLGPAVIGAVRDGGQLLAVRPYAGPAENGKAERDITVHLVLVGQHLHEGHRIAELADLVDRGRADAAGRRRAARRPRRGGAPAAGGRRGPRPPGADLLNE